MNDRICLARSRNSIPLHRSPESVVSITMQSNSPLPPITAQPPRTSEFTSRSDYLSPEIPKPRTPYEDKVIPTLRNRNRPDLGQPTPGTAMGNIDETESMIVPINDDATAELNQAEIIEANQMMIVFDKQLVNI